MFSDQRARAASTPRSIWTSFFGFAGEPDYFLERIGVDELQERAEIDALWTEQQRDDVPYVTPECRDMVRLDALDDYVGLEDGELVTFEPGRRGNTSNERGRVLVGTATWHGTTSGYVNHKCRCQPCRDAQAARVRKQRANRRAAK